MRQPGLERAAQRGLDPEDWSELRATGHRMLDDMLDHLMGLGQAPLWQHAPEDLRAEFTAPPPQGATPLDAVHTEFRDKILPYGSGNLHSGFMGWVQGGGTGVGMLAEMLAAGLNANLGGRDHMPIVVERQILHWMRALYGYPEGAGGQFLTGASQANFLAVQIARTRVLGPAARETGLAGARLVAYASAEVHGCVPRAMEMAGLGTDALRRIPVDGAGRMQLDALAAAIAADRAAGATPFLIVGTAGTVNTGAIDDLDAIATLAAREDLHFHVDGALGAPGHISPRLQPLFRGIERSDSLAFDFHKWLQVPYDAGYLLVRDEAWQRACFASDNAYLTRADRGLAGGEWWPCDTGPDLSRGFRALKAWFTIKTYGLEALAGVMERSCDLAQSLAAAVDAEPRLERLGPVALNVVCFAYRGTGQAALEDEGDTGEVNAKIVAALHEAGRVAPSLTWIGGKRAIRAAFVNHRNGPADVAALIAAVLETGARIEEAGR